MLRITPMAVDPDPRKINFQSTLMSPFLFNLIEYLFQW